MFQKIYILTKYVFVLGFDVLLAEVHVGRVGGRAAAHNHHGPQRWCLPREREVQKEEGAHGLPSTAH